MLSIKALKRPLLGLAIFGCWMDSKKVSKLNFAFLLFMNSWQTLRNLKCYEPCHPGRWASTWTNPKNTCIRVDWQCWQCLTLKCDTSNKCMYWFSNSHDLYRISMSSTVYICNFYCNTCGSERTYFFLIKGFVCYIFYSILQCK